ncbi:MAG: rhamnogalacturonan acetylesterase [Planctomycetales bacterium]|nr:rhamnogalacturonan acetylesterase [Planctomycetales bacterium]
MKHFVCPWMILVCWSIFYGAQSWAEEDRLPKIYIAGDSTAAGGVEGARGWGRHLQTFFQPEKVQIDNRARGGRSSRTFITEGLWDAIAAELQPRDIVLIQFGHNDGGSINDPQRARGSLPGLGDESREIDNLQTQRPEVVHTFGWYLKRMISDTRAKGAEPILLSLTVRNIWKDGHVERGSGRYGQWIRELAELENVPFIDLTNIVADVYEQAGPEHVANLFPRDHTHTSDEGALLNARFVVHGFQALREEMWSPWLSNEGKKVPRADPSNVLIPKVSRGENEASQQRFLNTPFPSDRSLPTLWLIGDSTVRTGRGRGELDQFGWGDPLQNFFDLGQLNVVNRAMGGTGARTFRTGGFWQPVLDMLQPGDVVLIQFGHNDNGQRGALRGIGTNTEIRDTANGVTETVESFGAYLREYVQEIQDKHATPILCSLIPRKSWEGNAIRRYEDGHADWTREVAKQQDILFIDLYERIALRYDEMGQSAVEPLFADQGVHTSFAGAQLNAQCVLEGLKAFDNNPLAKFLFDTEQHSQDNIFFLTR